MTRPDENRNNIPPPSPRPPPPRPHSSFLRFNRYLYLKIPRRCTCGVSETERLTGRKTPSYLLSSNRILISAVRHIYRVVCLLIYFTSVPSERYGFCSSGLNPFTASACKMSGLNDANSIFSGPIAHLLSMMCVLIKTKFFLNPFTWQ